MNRNILVWDIPTRLFHWLFALSFAIAWLTSERDEWLSVHGFFGYLMLGLLCFRLCWGAVGGYYARFSSFLYNPAEGFRYLRQLAQGKGARYIGHNPAGSQAVYLLLAAGLGVTITGLFTLGGEEQQGAIVGVVSLAAAKIIKEGHGLIAKLMLLLVFGHIVGVLVESWLHKENLPRSMVTGMKNAMENTPTSKPYRGAAVLLSALVILFGGWWFSYALQQPAPLNSKAQVAFVGPQLATDPQWREECGSCHLAFHPNLLPARSWQKMMAEQDKHFGTDLALDVATRKALLNFLTVNAAENSNREAAYKINRSLNAAESPLRITLTPYWVKKHTGIAKAVWNSASVKSKSNCAACHLDAEAGTFEDAAMRIPH